MRFTVVNDGNVFHRSSDACSVAPSRMAGCIAPAAVGETSSAKYSPLFSAERVTSTGITSASGAGVATFRERAPSAEQQQATAALAHEIGKHAHLLEREERGFDAAEYDGSVGEQLFARFREAGDELETILHTKSQEFVLGGSLQRNQPEISSSRTARRMNLSSKRGSPST